MSNTESMPPADAPSPGATPGLFARNATGLVRGVSTKSALIMNIVPGHPTFVLAVSFFFVFSLFPGGNYLLGLLLTVPMALALAYAWGLLVAMIPRSGGDYMLVSRVLHPLVGVISSFCMTVAVVLSAAFFGIATSTLALGPGLIVIGLSGHHPTLVDWGNTLLTSTSWQFFVGVLMMLLATLPLLGSWRFTLLIQNVWFWMTTGSLAACVLVAIFTSKSSFINNFNSFAEPYTHKADSYHSTIQTAVHAGVNVDPAFSFVNTIPVVGFFCGWAIFNWFSSGQLGGELRQASTIKTAHMMALGGLIPIAVVAVCAAIFFRTFGTSFQIAANGGGMPTEIAAPPTYLFLTAASVGSTWFAALLVICFTMFFPLLTYLNFLQPTRMLFAYAFDGILPKSVTRVNDRGVPYVAVIITLILAVLTLYWGLHASNFFQIITYAILIQLIATGLVGLSAIVVPYRHPEFYRAVTSRRNVLGLPLVVWAGAGSVATTVIVWILYFHYDWAFGFTDRQKFFSYLAGIVILAIVFFYGARAVRAREGVDVSARLRRDPT